MIVEGQQVQSIWYDRDLDSVKIIDQNLLPHELKIISLEKLSDACRAIKLMQVRGAPLIGVTAAYGVYLALKENPRQQQVAIKKLLDTRPTAVNLKWALDKMQESLNGVEEGLVAAKALEISCFLEKEDIKVCEGIGESGLSVLQALWNEKKDYQDCSFL